MTFFPLRRPSQEESRRSFMPAGAFFPSDLVLPWNSGCALGKNDAYSRVQTNLLFLRGTADIFCFSDYPTSFFNMDIDPPIKKRGRPKKKRRGRPPNSVRFLNAEIMKDVQATTSELINKVKKTSELFNEQDTTSESNSSGESNQIDAASNLMPSKDMERLNYMQASEMKITGNVEQDSVKNVSLSKSIEERSNTKALEIKVTNKAPETPRRGRPPKNPEEKNNMKEMKKIVKREPDTVKKVRTSKGLEGLSNMKILEMMLAGMRKPGGPKKPRAPKDTEKNNTKLSEMEKAGNKETGAMKKVKKTTALEEIKKIKALEMKIIEQGSKKSDTEKIKCSLKKTELPVKKTECPIKKTEFQIQKTEFPVTKTEFPVKKTEFPVKKAEFPVKKTEFSVQKTELPARKTEFSIQKTELPVKKTELPVKKTEISMSSTEIPVKKTELSMSNTEFPAKKIEPSIQKTELPAKKAEFSITKIELPVKKTDLSITKIELPVKKTDLSITKIQLPVKKTEFSIQKSDFPVKKVEISNVTSADRKELGTPKKIQILNLNAVKSKQPGTIKKILISDLNTVRRKQLVTTKKTDIKVRSSVFTFIAKCNRQRLPAKILTKKPIGKIKPAIHTIRMRLGQQNLPKTPQEESSTMVKKNDSGVNATEFIIMQKQKNETQSSSESSNCPATVHADTSPDLVPVDTTAIIPEVKSPENNMPVLDAENNEMPITDHSETDEGEMTKDIPLEPAPLDAIENVQPGEEKEIKMQSPQKDEVHQSTEIESENMPILKDNSIVYTDIPPRMEEKLPECYVLLHRLTEEQIHMKYPYDSSYDVSDDIKSKTEELLSKTVEAMDDEEHGYYNPFKRDGSRRCMRRTLNLNSAAFQKYKRNREAYLNRRNRSSHSENSLDWSQDEFRTFSDGGKPKKKVKRSHKYERDYEWNPYNPKGNSFVSRTLRRHSRIPLIESESSTSEDDEAMYDMYMEQDNNDDYYDNSAFLNAVPSKDSASVAVNESSINTSSSASVNQNSNIQKANSVPGDILSDIIKDMNQLQKNRSKTSFGDTFKPVNNSKSNNFKSKPVQKRRKRPADLELSKMSTEKVISLLLKEMVTKVAAKFRYLETKVKKSVRCKWCHTQFTPNRATDIMCAICKDLGIERELEAKSVATKIKPVNPGKVKLLKENKGKKVNNTMSRVLKNLPKNEMQRLMYAEKTDKLSVVKGYNHCKSFATPKQTKNVNDSTRNSDNQNKHSNKISLKVNETSVKSAQIRGKDGILANKIQSKNKFSGQIKSKVPIGSEEYENSQNKHRVSLEKYNDGLFLMTFPDPDKELDLEDKSPHIQIKQNGTTENTNKLNNEQMGNVSQVSNQTQLQPVATKKYDTYLFPPIPTVIVSNYSSNTNSLNLSHTYFQNEITQQHALKSSKPQPNVSTPKVSTAVTVSNTITCKSPSIASSMLSNNSMTITAIPISNSMSQIQPFTVSTVPVMNSQPSVPASNMTLLPILSSVMSLADNNINDSNKLKEIVPSNFSSNNFVNSQQLDIKIDNVTSLKTYQKQDSSPESILNNDVNSFEFAQNKRADSVIVKSAKSGELPAKRKRLNSDRLSSENSETSDIEDLAKNKNETAGNNHSLNALMEDRLSGSNMGDHFEHSSKELDKSIADKENVAPQSAIASAIDMLGAISILAVIDLEKNPQNGLNVRIQHTKNQLGKLTSEKISTPEHNEKIASCQYNLTLLNIAKKYLSLYGSFIKVSDHLLRKAQMIQIKKEIHEEETNQSSCMFSQSSQLNSSLSSSRSDLSKTPDIASVPQMRNFNSSTSNNQASISHIEKLKSQIAAMNNIQLEMAQYGVLPGGGTVHHYPPDQIAALTPNVAAPTPVTPRNDCLIGESRETPSRGSGPRTPARPESAASQSEEQTLIQVKKEQFEAANSPPSQCAYSQNTTLPQISSQIPVMSGVPDLNMPQSVVNSTHLPVSSSNQVYPNQTNFSVQPAGIVPNRTAPYTSNQSYSDMFLNVGSKPQLRVTQTPQNPEMRQNQQVILGQQMFIQNGSGMCSKQVVPSVNNNQYVIRPPYTTSGFTNTSGTLIVNNSQVGQNALLTNVSNQQFYTSNQVSQLYYPPSSQITCMPSNNIPTMVTQEISSAGIQQAEIESPDQMLCAVCNSQATLRCKQCARVAYCNTTCAKTYWHQKHKMECKPLGS